MRIAIAVDWKPGIMVFDYETVKLSAQAKGITLQDQLEMLCDKLDFIEQYYTESFGNED
jgi:hypothetical protein